jgi:hypothetical protein
MGAVFSNLADLLQCFSHRLKEPLKSSFLTERYCLTFVDRVIFDFYEVKETTHSIENLGPLTFVDQFNLKIIFKYF